MATSEQQSNQGDRPAGITCPHYEALPGRKHCRHYLDNGGCSLPTEFMCVEWMKANGHLAPDATQKPAAAAPESPLRQALASSPLDLFGNPNPDYRSTDTGSPAPSSSRREASSTVPSPAMSMPTDDADTTDRSPQRGLTTEDIDSFKALRAEVCLSSDAFGEVWLVPEYTGQGRKEITPEHAATICRVIEAFPGSRVVSFEKTPKSDEETTS
jgi:hypothetical protein